MTGKRKRDRDSAVEIRPSKAQALLTADLEARCLRLLQEDYAQRNYKNLSIVDCIHILKLFPPGYAESTINFYSTLGSFLSFSNVWFYQLYGLDARGLAARTYSILCCERNRKAIKQELNNIYEAILEGPSEFVQHYPNAEIVLAGDLGLVMELWVYPEWQGYIDKKDLMARASGISDEEAVEYLVRVLTSSEEGVFPAEVSPAVISPAVVSPSTSVQDPTIDLSIDPPSLS